MNTKNKLMFCGNSSIDYIITDQGEKSVIGGSAINAAISVVLANKNNETHAYNYLKCNTRRPNCNQPPINEAKILAQLEKEKLQQDMEKYIEIDEDTEEILANIAKLAANVGVFLKSPIISKKRDILRLILSDCKTDGKNLCFSITKPFDVLLKTPKIEKWCGILHDYRTNHVAVAVPTNRAMT